MEVEGNGGVENSKVVLSNFVAVNEDDNIFGVEGFKLLVLVCVLGNEVDESIALLLFITVVGSSEEDGIGVVTGTVKDLVTSEGVILYLVSLKEISGVPFIEVVVLSKNMKDIEL